MGLDEDRAVVQKIRTLLKAHPKGLIITEIARQLRVNRNSAAKYLEILLFTGQVEVRQIGMAKVYSASQRVSLSGLLQFAQEQILVLDDGGRIIQANDRLLHFWRVSREDLLGETLERAGIPALTGITPLGPDEGAERREFSFGQDGRTVHCRLSLIPTVFEDGGFGTTLIIEDITAEREYEQRLAESEARYRAVVEDQTEMISRHRPDGTITFANRAWLRFFGDEGSQNPVFREIIATAGDNASHVPPDSPASPGQWQVRNAGGEIRWIEGTVHALQDPQCIEREYQLVLRDVTEAHDRRRELLIKEAAMAASIDGLVIVGADERIEYANRAFITMFGYDRPSEVVGLKYVQLSHGDLETALVIEKIRNVLEHEGRWTGEIRCIRRDGSPFTARVSASTVRDGAGTFLCVLLSFVDLTDRLRTEQALKRSREKLQETIEFIPDATFILDRDRCVVAWNRSMEKMTGILREEMIGSQDYGRAFSRFGGSFPVLVDLVDLPTEELVRRCPGVRRIGETLFYETWVPSLHGGRGGYLWGKASFLIDHDQNLIGAMQTLRDITEWKRAEESYRDASAREQAIRRALEQREQGGDREPPLSGDPDRGSSDGTSPSEP